MDSQGSIQVNHRKTKTLVYRFVMKIKKNEPNQYLFNLFQVHIGGQSKKQGEELV